MQFFKRLARFIFSVYGFAVFLILMFFLFPFIVLASLFGEIKGGNAIYILCRFWADACLFCFGIRHRNIYDAPFEPGKSCIFVFNHSSYLDIPILLATFRRQPIRVLGKAEMSKVPVFGFIYRKAAVMVDRSDASHRAQSVSRLKAVLRKEISIVIAPEGTFNTTGKPLKLFYDGAFRIAIETQTPIRPAVFLDAFDRLSPHSIFSLNPGRSRSVFLPEIEVDKMDTIESLKLKVYQCMEDALIRHHASWITNTHE